MALGQTQQTYGNHAVQRAVPTGLEGSLPDGDLSAVRSVLNGGGEPLDRAIRAWAEPRLGRDLADVRVHTGTAAADTAGMDLSMLRLDAILPGLGAGGGYTMPGGPRLTNYQNSFGLPPQGRSGFRDRLAGNTHPTQAEALVHEADARHDRFERIRTRLLDKRIHHRCIGGSTTFGDCEGHCRGRTATACLGRNLNMLCRDFWTSYSHDARALLLIHEAAHLVFSISHGRNLSHADCYAAYAAASTLKTWSGTPPCAP